MLTKKSDNIQVLFLVTMHIGLTTSMLSTLSFLFSSSLFFSFLHKSIPFCIKLNTYSILSIVNYITCMDSIYLSLAAINHYLTGR